MIGPNKSKITGITLNMIIILCNVVLMIYSHFTLDKHPNSNMFSCLLTIGGLGIVIGIIGSWGIGMREKGIIHYYILATNTMTITQGSAATTYWSLREIIDKGEKAHELSFLIILVIMVTVQSTGALIARKTV